MLIVCARQRGVLIADPVVGLVVEHGEHGEQSGVEQHPHRESDKHLERAEGQHGSWVGRSEKRVLFRFAVLFSQLRCLSDHVLCLSC